MAVPISRLVADLKSIEQAAFDSVIDVRSPAEFADDHIPGAINLPVLDNEQRAEIGTLYKQQSPFMAKRAGAALVARNIAHHLETSLRGMPREWRPLVYCWRGGQRSGAMAKVFSDIGWRASVIDGGYKAYRRAVLNQLEALPAGLNLILIAGKTGTAKTRILRAGQARGLQVIDLEGLASHRGSLLGREPGQTQPSQRLFESRLAAVLGRMSPARPVFVEAESNKIGQLHVPPALWAQMRSAGRITIDAPLAARIAFLLDDYRHITVDHSDVARLLSGLRTRHSGALIQSWKDQIESGDWASLIASLLESHYDPSYSRSTASRGAQELMTLSTERLDSEAVDGLVARLVRFDKQL